MASLKLLDMHTVSSLLMEESDIRAVVAQALLGLEVSRLGLKLINVLDL